MNTLVIPHSSCDQEGAESNSSSSPHAMVDDRMEERKKAETREDMNSQEERKIMKAPLTTQNDSEGEELKEELRNDSLPQEGKSLEEMFSQTIASLEFVSEVQETQYSNESLASPFQEGQQKTQRWEASLAGQEPFKSSILKLQ